MKNNFFLLGVILIIVLTGCSASRKAARTEETHGPGLQSTVVIKNKVPVHLIDTRDISALDVVNFAETLIGVKYKYGSAIKKNGFDCSGFINYVFNHFNISVPRSSVDFTNSGKEVSVYNSLPGDLILFTGSDPKSGVVGHMGIITGNKNGDITFIHASQSRGVMISGMNAYFIPRFVKVIRVFQAE